MILVENDKKLSNVQNFTSGIHNYSVPLPRSPLSFPYSDCVCNFDGLLYIISYVAFSFSIQVFLLLPELPHTLFSSMVGTV